MAEWRAFGGWTETELQERLAALRPLSRNFDDPIADMTPERGWHQYGSEAVIAVGPPGPPEDDGPFYRGRTAVTHYEFSDPRIVMAHYDAEVPLEGRRMLLQMRALRHLHYLGGVVVGAVRSEEHNDRTVFGFRYDTLEGHIETGAEWFLLSKDHESGQISFRIQASWRRGEFPNWWSELGFTVLGPYYQRKWHERAHQLLSRRAQQIRGRPPKGTDGLVHITPEVVFNRTAADDGST